MTKYTVDIVERLRVWPAAYGEDTMGSTYVRHLMKCAADEIERLRTPAPADGEALREALMNIAALTPETNANRNCTCTSCEARRIALAALTHAPAPASEGVRDQAFKTAEILESDVIINRDYRSFLAKQLRAALAPEPADTVEPDDGEDHLGERR